MQNRESRVLSPSFTGFTVFFVKLGEPSVKAEGSLVDIVNQQVIYR